MLVFINPKLDDSRIPYSYRARATIPSSQIKDSKVVDSITSLKPGDIAVLGKKHSKEDAEYCISKEINYIVDIADDKFDQFKHWRFTIPNANAVTTTCHRLGEVIEEETGSKSYVIPDIMKKAIITGITGQDGSYLAKLLLSKGYKVYGAQRRNTGKRYWRLDELGIRDNIEFVDIDLTEPYNIEKVIDQVQPDEFYNLAAQSFVALSFEQPQVTTLTNSLGVLNILEVIRNKYPQVKFYQASTSEMFGKVVETPQKETTRFYPRSPYGCAKAYSHFFTVNYRESI
jgi:hypothetical protein